MTIEQPAPAEIQSARSRGNVYTRAARRRLEPALLLASRGRGYAQVLGNIGVFAALLYCASIARSPWLLVGLVPAIGLAQHRLFFPVHDCLHYSLFRSKAENRFWGIILSGLLGTSFEAIRDQHMEHHREFGTLEDPGASDYFVRFGSRKEFLRFVLGPLFGSILLNKLGDYMLRPARAAAEPLTARSSRAPTPVARKLTKYLAILCIQAAVCALLSRGFQPTQLWRYPVFNVLPAVTVFLFLVRLRMFLEHGSLDYSTCDYFAKRRPTARTIYGSRLEQVFLCGSDFNFHHEHHLYPVVPGWQLPKLHRELLAADLDHEDIRTSYMEAFAEIWKNLSPRSVIPVDSEQAPQRDEVASLPKSVQTLR